MKSITNLFALALVMSISMLLVSCNSSPKIEKATDKNGKEYTSAYICPMYCKGSGSAQPGKCPACKMDYLANANTKQHQGHNHDHSGHNHSHDHSGHNHSHDHKGHDHSGHKHDGAKKERHPHDHDGDGKPDH